MNTKQIESKFTAMGARLKVREIPQWVPYNRQNDYSLAIQRDRKGEHFELRVPVHLRGLLDVFVIQSEPKLRHLLLFVRKTENEAKPTLDRFLCGHDEREWFIATVGGGASSVRQAMDALQPAGVKAALARNPVSSQKRYARNNRAFRRQGEWFFVPEPAVMVPENLILHNEPLIRGAGKPHWVEQLYRTGGETVYVCAQRPNGLLEREYRKLLSSRPSADHWEWRIMRRNPGVHVRGTVRHSDHAPITLPCWHQVFLNSEVGSNGHSAFLD
jgi:hypothetical protein